jgi:excisionase family DNA binding protein
MRKNPSSDSEPTQVDNQAGRERALELREILPNRLLTACEVAHYVHCHEETVRRAYLRGLLASQRFGVRGRRFHPADVIAWMEGGLRLNCSRDKRLKTEPCAGLPAAAPGPPSPEATAGNLRGLGAKVGGELGEPPPSGSEPQP